MDRLNLTVITFNLSFSGHLPYHSWYYNGLIPAVVLSFCFVLGVPGNIAVILLRPKWQKISSLSQSLMLNLAISDPLCLLILPSTIHSFLYDWIFGLVACKLLSYLLYCSIYASQLTVTVLGVQRYLQVVRKQRWDQEQKRVLLVLLWLVAVVLSIPVLVVHQVTTDQQWTVCELQYSSEAQWVVVLLIETLFGFFCLFLVVFGYIHLHRKINQAAFFNNPQTTRLITSIIVSNFLLGSPYIIINVLGVAAIYVKNKGLLKFCSNAWNIVKALTVLIRCLNPLLYAFNSRKTATAS